MNHFMAHHDALERFFWRALPLSLLLHLLLGVWFVRGLAFMRQVAAPQVISVELREMPLTPPPPLTKQQEPSVRRLAAPVARAKVSVARPLPPPAPPALVPQQAREDVPHPSVQTAVAVVRTTVELHGMATPIPTVAGKPDAAVVRPVEQAVPVKDPGRAEAVAKAYFSRVRSHLERNKEYPALALRGRLEGAVTVRFTIRNDGTVAVAGIVTSSGYKLLDQSALRTVHVSAPFPKPPEIAGSREISVSVPLVYKMDL